MALRFGDRWREERDIYIFASKGCGMVVTACRGVREWV
jgi:hypothetical protein